MNLPIISVIIPTYNRAEYLKKTLESVLNQTYKNLDVIVVDDGTKGDANRNLCIDYNVKYIKIKNSGGPAVPRNVGIREAKGEFLAFLDDDDIWYPEKLEKQVNVLINNLEFGLVHSCCEVIDENGNDKNQIIGRPGNPNVKHGDVSMRMMGNWTLMMPTPLVRKDVITRVGFFNEKIPPATEDVEYWTRCSFFTKFYYIDQPLVRYRIHSNNISAETKRYIDLPLHLKNVLIELKLKQIINENQYENLICNLCAMQIKMFKKHIFKTLNNLFKLNKNWFLRWKNLKLLMFIIVKR